MIGAMTGGTIAGFTATTIAITGRADIGPRATFRRAATTRAIGAGVTGYPRRITRDLT
jgi:hypothetical protein